MAFDWLRRLAAKDSGNDKNIDGLSRAIELTAAGRAALAQGHARQALELLTEKHELVVAHWGKDAVFSATSAIDLADAFLACGNLLEADRMLKWALDRYHALGVDDARYLRALSKWAMSAYQAADYRAAESRFADLIDRYKGLGSEHDVERAMAMDHLAQVYLRQSKPGAAEPLLVEALTIFERDGSDALATAICRSLLARLRYMGGRYREAEQLQRRAIACYEAVNDEMNLAKELDHLGATLAMRAQSEQNAKLADEAVTHGKRAVAIFEKYLPSGHYSLLGSKQNLEQFKSMSEQIGKMFSSGSGPSSDPALAVPEGHPFAIVQLLNLAWKHCEAHDYDEALRVSVDARNRAIRNFGDQSPLAGEAAANVVGILRRHCSYLLGEPTGVLLPSASFMMQMRAHARRGIAEDETTPGPEIDPRVRTTVESLLQQAVKFVDEVTALASSDLGDLGSGNAFSSEDFSSDVLEILHYARRLGVLENEVAIRKAFEIMQIHGDNGAAQGLIMGSRRAGESEAQRMLRDEYRLAVLERDTLIRSLVEAKDRIAASSAAATSAQLPAVEEKIAALQNQLQEEGQFAAQRFGSWLSLDDARSALGATEAIIAILVGRRATFLVGIRPDEVAFKRVEMEDGLVRVMCERGRVRDLEKKNEAPPDFALINALQIHDLVFYPLKEFLKPASHLLVLADGPLWTLPLGCLLAEPMGQPEREALGGSSPEPVARDADKEEIDAADQDGRSHVFDATRHRLFRLRTWLEARTAQDAVSAVSEGGAWLADRYRISLMPSLAPLKVRSRVANRPGHRRAFLGIGDPQIGSAAHLEHFAIPETRRILTYLATALGGDPVSDVVVGSATTLDRLVDLSESGELANRRVLCFATHAVYPRSNGDLLTDAGLLFSQEEVLTAFDIAGLRIDADFVLLTACFTGSPSGRSITVPLSGLAQAFLTAGARSLLVSHWPVEVRATELFVEAFAAAIGDNDTLVEALAGAEKLVRNSSQEHAHPAFWAGFSIIGDGATRLGA